MSHKQVIVIRKDLNMRKGKMIAQGAHASMAAILNLMTETYHDVLELQLHDPRLKPWITGSFKKICVYVNSEEELLELYEKAKENGMIHALITDSGATEFHGIPTRTALAIGPDFDEKIDEITGHLKLL